MREPTREQNQFAEDRATDFDRARVVRLPDVEYVFVVGENYLPGGEPDEDGEYPARWEAAWLVMPDGYSIRGDGEYVNRLERLAAQAAWEADVAHAAEMARALAAGEIRCVAHPDAPAVTEDGKCEVCWERDAEAREEALRDRYEELHDDEEDEDA